MNSHDQFTDDIGAYLLGALDPAARRKWLVPDDVTGAVVVAVAPGSAAADAAVLAGDVLIRVGNTAVDTAADLETGVTAAMRAGRAAALLLIYRRGNERFVGVVLRQGERAPWLEPVEAGVPAAARGRRSKVPR